MFELMHREFPDFDQTTLPTIPANWLDTSWHNDACPSFLVYRNEFGVAARVFIDYADRALSEMPEHEQFSIVIYNESDGADIAAHEFATFNDLLAAIQEIDANV